MTLSKHEVKHLTAAIKNATADNKTKIRDKLLLIFNSKVFPNLKRPCYIHDYFEDEDVE